MTVFFLCLKIFFARICDVSLGSIRTILMVKGKSFYAALIGFIEITIWFLIVKEALNTELTNIWVVLSYSGGFAAGVYIGGIISDIFIPGNFSVQIITNNGEKMLETIKNNGFGVTMFNIEKNKNMLIVQIDKKRFNDIKKIIKIVDKKAFLFVYETKYVQNGYFTK